MRFGLLNIRRIKRYPYLEVEGSHPGRLRHC